MLIHQRVPVYLFQSFGLDDGGSTQSRSIWDLNCVAVGGALLTPSPAPAYIVISTTFINSNEKEEQTATLFTKY